MATKTGLCAALLAAGRGERPLRNHTRTLRVEQLEPRLVLNVTVSGVLHRGLQLGHRRGTAMRNALVQASIPVVYTDANGHVQHTIISDTADQAFTSATGQYTITDTRLAGKNAAPTRSTPRRPSE